MFHFNGYYMLKKLIFASKHINFKINYKLFLSFWTESSLLDYSILLTSEIILKKLIIYSFLTSLNLTISENFVFKLYILLFSGLSNSIFFFKNKINFIIISLILILNVILLFNVLVLI